MFSLYDSISELFVFRLFFLLPILVVRTEGKPGSKADYQARKK